MTNTPHSDTAQQVEIEKIALLFKENQQGLLMSLLVASITALVSSWQIGYTKPLNWWLLSSSVLLVRLAILAHFQRRVELNANNHRYWEHNFALGAAAYGLVWGLSVPYFSNQLSLELMLLCIMVIISICVGAMPYLCYSLKTVQVYLLTILGPPTLWLVCQASFIEVIIGLTCMVFALSTFLMARKLNTMVTNSMRLQLENANLSRELISTNTELEALSRLDALCGIANRRAFEQAFATALAQAQRDAEVLSILMIDIDHFKQFNDRYGHLVGDKVIYQVAQVLEQQLKRPADLLARYGGEEFIAMLPDTPASGGQRIAETMREAVAALDISDIAPQTLQLTISIGVTCRPAREASTLADFVHWADQGLYTAKAAGRNRVVVQLPECSATFEMRQKDRKGATGFLAFSRI